jgi:two-component system, NarL family, response regulator DevR
LPSPENILALQNKFCMSNDDGKLVVLLVDDSLLIVDKVLGLLQELENIRIIFQASTCSEAIIIVEEAEPDIVLMDIFLGGRISFELLKILGENHPSVETAVISNHAGARYRESCKKLGARHFFDKSTEFRQLVKMMSEKK